MFKFKNKSYLMTYLFENKTGLIA